MKLTSEPILYQTTLEVLPQKLTFLQICTILEIYIMAKIEKMTFIVKLKKPVCRTPIKPVQKHKNDVKFSRKVKHLAKISLFLKGE
jgi:hypothetical protein